MNNDHLNRLREEYNEGSLRRADLLMDPVEQFKIWFAEALEAEGELEANVMTLATADVTGHPSARMVLLKGILDGGFVFFTNYQSRKGQDLLANPRAALVFWWRRLQRQVRIEGDIEIVSVDYSKAYFDSRPLGSRLSAIISPQSQVIENRSSLEKKLVELQEKTNKGLEVKKPSDWGGYALTPDRIEFWQGRENRLHDRFQYTRKKSGWHIDRLAP